MGSYAWYYHAEGRTYYWTESYTLSASGFAFQVSKMVGQEVTAADISAANRAADLDRIRRIADKLIYVS